MARKIEIKPIVIKILIGIGILLLGLLMACLFIQTAHSRKTAELLDDNLKQIEAEYAQKVAQDNDAGKLTKSGLRQLNINLPNLALISLNRATQVQQNYRDGWLALGLAQLKTGDIKAALISFQAAEKLDPINAKTYELLKIAYEKLEDTASAQKASEKYEFLTKR